MEVDSEMCGQVNLANISNEDKQAILNICQMCNVSVAEFGNYIDAALCNDSGLPLKDIIKNSQTELNKKIQMDRVESVKAKSQKKKTYSLEQIISMLSAFSGKRAVSESDKNFENRENISTTLKNWNADNVAEIEGKYSMNVSLDFNIINNIDTYDHWNLSAEKRVEVLNSQFEEFIGKLKEEQVIKDVHELGTTSNDVVTVVGRLINTDSDVPFGSNIELINLSEDNENGMSKIKLNFNEGEQLCFFEGQIVVLEGTSDHDTFNVSRIVPLPIKTKPEQDNVAMEEGSLSVLIFNGPYWFADSINYTLLKYVTHLINQQNPHLVILGGPFLDINHERMSEGELFYKDDDGSVNCFEDLEIYGAIKKYLEKETDGLQTKIVMIPSLNDMVSLSPFPQPPLSKNSTDRISFLPNPARFSVNGVEFGIVNTDIARQALSKSHTLNPKKHRLNLVLEQIVSQRSFFPLYPPREDTPVDISKYKLYEMPYAPEILVTMSELPVFTDSIDDKIVFLNPGQVAKQNARGTYACVTINNDVSSGTLRDKVRVDIKNI